MDDRNGESFDREELYGQLTASDSEQECLREFLLDAVDPSRNVPCSKAVSDEINNCANSLLLDFPESSFTKPSAFENTVDAVNRTTEGTEFPHNCEELIMQPTVSSLDPMRSTRTEDNASNGNFFSLDNMNNLNLINSVNNILEHGGESVESTRTPSEVQSHESASNSVSNSVPSVSPDSLQSPATSSESKFSPSDVKSSTSKKSSPRSSPSNSKKSSPSESKKSSPSDKKSPMGNGLQDSAKTKKRKVPAVRGRPPGPAKKKVQPVTYQSQISPDQNGIKIFIKKSLTAPTARAPKSRERTKKRKTKKGSDTEESGGEMPAGKRVRFKGVESAAAENEEEEPTEQSVWGLCFPEALLHQIFMMITNEEGCVPFLCRVSKVCRLWNSVSRSPSLWHSIDLSGQFCKQRHKNKAKFDWLCENRLTKVQDLNLSGWTFPVVHDALERIWQHCRELRGLNVSGWTSITAEHIKDIATNCKKLQRIDLSSVCSERTYKSCMGSQSLTNLAQTLGEQLTHLMLADNKITGFPLIISALAEHCPNLQVLDISNMKSQNTTTMHIERLQQGCQKLRVLRMTNSEISLTQTPLMEQAAAPGFPLLEELSVAGIGVDGLMSLPIIDDNAIERILKSSNKLRLLDVRGCTRITDSSLVRIPAWDLEHLFLSGCYVTRLTESGLELIMQKWCHSLVEVDLAWSTATQCLDQAVGALADCESESPLRVLNLCGSSVSLEPVQRVLKKCPHLVSLNLASCRALPRGIKRLYEQEAVEKLRLSMDNPGDSDKKSPSTPSDTDGPSGSAPPETADVD